MLIGSNYSMVCFCQPKLCRKKHVDTIYTVCVLYVSYGDSINDHFHYESMVSIIGKLQMH